MVIDTGILRIGLFFDGTRNNARNLASNHEHLNVSPRPLLPALDADDGSPYLSPVTSSYDRGLTNIARLHALYPDARRDTAQALSLALYTEGAGTRDGEPDDLFGLAFGIGPSGVLSKAKRALDVQLPAALQELAALSPQPITGIRVDLFGFSRGAASARDAANRLQAWTPAHWLALLGRAGLQVSPAFAVSVPLIGFIGLFDTVVAVASRTQSERPQLHLASGIAGKVVQLVARDELRAHFTLTTVAPEHTEYLLPGAHADIGGGNDEAVEGPKLLTRPQAQRLRTFPFSAFADPPQSWLHGTDGYREASAAAAQWREHLGLQAEAVWPESWHQWQRQRRAGSASVLPEPVLYVYSAVVLKRPLQWRYQLVPLRIMHSEAAAAGVRWTRSPDDVDEMALPEELRPISDALLAGQPLQDPLEKLLRQRYLSQSAHWNFDALGDTELAYATDASVGTLPYRPGPGLFYINRPADDRRRLILPNV